jgi:hypothetical protein
MFWIRREHLYFLRLATANVRIVVRGVDAGYHGGSLMQQLAALLPFDQRLLSPDAALAAPPGGLAGVPAGAAQALAARSVTDSPSPMTGL